MCECRNKVWINNTLATGVMTVQLSDNSVTRCLCVGKVMISATNFHLGFSLESRELMENKRETRTINK